MSDEKKIIIDEDWKTQVQAEKEAAKHAPVEPASQTGESASQTGEPASAGGPTASGTSSAPPHDPSMPPASFELLVTTLATEALVALGQVPHPATNKAELHRNHAQYIIDTLDVLRQKTKGNLSPQEQQLIDDVLHQMRLLFVAVANQSSTTPSA